LKDCWNREKNENFWLEVVLAGLMKLYGGLMQIPGVDVQELTMTENMAFVWDETGFMRWPLALCVLIGFVVIIYKFSC